MAPQPHHHEDDGYAGPATIVVDEHEFTVEIDLRGHFQPIDGRYHWYGRLRPNSALSQALGGKKRPALVRTPNGTATCELSDPDPWDRYRVMGISTPPFTVPTSVD